MPVEPSDRLLTVSEFYFSKKLREVAKMRESGIDVISLAIGSPDLPPDQRVINTLVKTAQRKDSHGYQPYNGVKPLREAFSDFYQRTFGVSLDPNHVLPLLGSKEGIVMITLAYCNTGDSTLIPNPGYAMYKSTADLLGVNACSYNLTDDRQYQPDMKELERLVAQRSAVNSPVKIMWANYPHMPTGTPGTREIFKKLLRFAEAHNILLVNDNPYSLILPNGAPLSILSVANEIGSKASFLELNSLSKSHGMPGWRVGAVVGNDPKLLQPILTVKTNFDNGSFLAIQMAAATALTEVQQSYHNHINDAYRKRRDVAFAILDVLECTYHKHQVGMFVWAKAPTHWHSVEAEVDRILNTAHVFITPGRIFGTNGDRHVRVSLCCDLLRLEEALVRIKLYVVKRRAHL
ncbi:LL-diaminopimelate aminotransferase [Diplonema papillatum]|nr:LL-diaminopimelate aminotransferase [Diplonema papillatum]|eukprot:gene4116-6405_t